MTTLQSAREKHLIATIRKATLDLFQATGTGSVLIKLDQNSDTLWFAAGTLEEIQTTARIRATARSP